MESVAWDFDYKGKHFENVLKDFNTDGDFSFRQNGNLLAMIDPGERYFLPIIIYGMQKIKSPEETKEELSKKYWTRGLDSEVSFSNYGAYGYYSNVFMRLNKFNEYEISYGHLKGGNVKVDEEFKILHNSGNEIVFPYDQLSVMVDKLIDSSKKGLFRTHHEDVSKMIGHYVSGEFERESSRNADLQSQFFN